MHDYRMRRTGSYDLAFRQRAALRSHTAGYVMVYDPSHPLVDRTGYVYEHRRIMFDIHGAGPHACYWCGIDIDWRAGLEVDHVDYDRANNAVSNLVLSCHGCNSRRARHRNQHSK